MGVLTAGSISGQGGDPGPTQDIGPGADPVSDAPAVSEPPAKPDPKDFIPFERIKNTPKTPGSRREQAEREMNERIASTARAEAEKLVAAEREQYQRALREQAENTARIQGELEAVRRMPMPAPVAAPAGPDPAELRQQARKALDEKDFDRYQDLNERALRLEMQREADQRVKNALAEFQKTLPPPPLPHHIQALIGRHEHVAMKGDEGLRLVWLKEQELQLMYGVPPSHARTQKAFELVNSALKPAGSNGRQSYDPSAAAALSAAPTTRPAGGGGGEETEGYTPTALEKETAKNAGIPIDEYVRWKFPERFANQRR